MLTGEPIKQYTNHTILYPNQLNLHTNLETLKKHTHQTQTNLKKVQPLTSMMFLFHMTMDGSPQKC